MFLSFFFVHPTGGAITQRLSQRCIHLHCVCFHLRACMCPLRCSTTLWKWGYPLTVKSKAALSDNYIVQHSTLPPTSKVIYIFRNTRLKETYWQVNTISKCITFQEMMEPRISQHTLFLSIYFTHSHYNIYIVFSTVKICLYVIKRVLVSRRPFTLKS